MSEENYLLLISHGTADANPLTRPVNAEVLHQELEALGRETNLDQ
jgi:hypothetical protein